MGKVTHRRERRLAAELQTLSRSNPKTLHRAWRARLHSGWVELIPWQAKGTKV